MILLLNLLQVCSGLSTLLLFKFLHHNINGYIFRGSNSVCFFVFCLHNKGQLLKEKNLLLWEQILSFKCRPLFWKGFIVLGSNQAVIKIVSLSKYGGNMKRGYFIKLP